MTILNMDFFLKLFAKALHQDFFLVKQEQQLGAHTGKYTKIESILQGLRKYEVSPNRVYFIGTLDQSLSSSPGAHPGHEYTYKKTRLHCQHDHNVNRLSQSTLIAKGEGDFQTSG